MNLQPHVTEVLQHVRSTSTQFAEREVSDAARLLYRAGVQVVGSGSYSVVLPHEDPDKVVKLSFSVLDGYHDYVSFVQAATEETVDPELLPHLPVIYSSVVQDGVRITVLERLEPFDCIWEDITKARELLDPHMPQHCFCDIGRSNVMYRKDGTLVITDPWGGKEGS
jgi:hypothetical protein